MAFDYDEGWKFFPHADAIIRLQFQTNEDEELGATNAYNEVNLATCKSIRLTSLKSECS